MLRLLRFYRSYDKAKHSVINIICAATLMWAIAYAAFEYFMPLILEGIALDYAHIGMILSIPALIALVFDVFIGYLQTRIKSKRLFIISLVMFLLIAYLLYYHGNLLTTMIFVMVLYGLGFDFFDITAYSSIFRHSDYYNSSSNISLRDVFEGIGIIIGGILIGFVFSKSPQGSIIIFALFTLLAMLLIMFLYNERAPLQKAHINLKQRWNTMAKDFKLIFKGKTMYLLVLVMFLTIWDGLFFGFESLFAHSFTDSMVDPSIFAGILMAVYLLPMILFEYSFGRLEDKIGKTKFIITGLFVLGGGIFLISISQDTFMLMVSVFVASTGAFSVSWPAITGHYEDLSSHEIGRGHSGESVGMLELFENIGYFIGPLLGGILISLMDFQGAFLVMSLVILALAALSMFIFRIGKTQTHNKSTTDKLK